MQTGSFPRKPHDTSQQLSQFMMLMPNRPRRAPRGAPELFPEAVGSLWALFFQAVMRNLFRSQLLCFCTTQSDCT